MNTMQYASVFMTELDKQLVEKSTTGWMEDNAKQVQYNGGAEVKIPKMTMSGLGDYDRNSGFANTSLSRSDSSNQNKVIFLHFFFVDKFDVNLSNVTAVVSYLVFGHVHRLGKLFDFS